ncbi:TetR/AcrR family transcriptional regulator [Streptomyces sp. SID3343]|uniref:TetR/AcrR family transcriptional regulator n=1 Tax=Streptomyces sp. SID3343 TaxID=2690260 RepID=UPI00136BF2D5|nr:TetR/AcrR family transcriptional regulator [Streptomyces sp. SID3343]MYW04982.1 TetR family transcriptional regulator [Streptomyces sp. SID3343]
MTDSTAPRRPHTGRRRNEDARTAILDAVLVLLGDSGGAPVTIDTIARAAGVGKQTIYRWWPSKGAVLLDALTGLAGDVVSAPAGETLYDDLAAFLTATFRGTGRASTAAVLRSLVREAARDPHAAGLVRTFTAARREALRELFARHGDEFAPDADLDLLVDQAYGVLWYRFLLEHHPLSDRDAAELARGLTVQAGARS